MGAEWHADHGWDPRTRSLHLEEYDAAHRFFPLDHMFRDISWKWVARYRDSLDPVYVADTIRTALAEDPYNPMLIELANGLKERGHGQ